MFKAFLKIKTEKKSSSLICFQSSHWVHWNNFFFFKKLPYLFLFCHFVMETSINKVVILDLVVEAEQIM